MDLAVGGPFDDVGSTPDAAAVNVIHGSRSGLTSLGGQYWNEDGDVSGG